MNLSKEVVVKACSATDDVADEDEDELDDEADGSH